MIYNSSHNHLALNEATLKELKTMTASISYCRHTHIKIVIGTEFHNSSLKNKLVRSEHPVFNLDCKQLIRLLKECRTPTEKYLASTALLVKSGLFDTSHYGLHLDSRNFAIVERELMKILTPLVNYINTAVEMRVELPTLVISPDNCESGSMIKNYFRTIGNRLEAYYTSLIPHHNRKSNALAMDDEIELERDLIKILSGYSLKATRYSPRTGKWAIKQMRIKNADITEQQLVTISHYLNNPTLERLNIDTLKSVIVLAKESLPYEDSDRANSLMVIRHLEAKLETINNINASLGFITLEEESSYNKDALMRYTTKTKVTDSITINNTVKVVVTNPNPSGMTALDRMRAKFATTSI